MDDDYRVDIEKDLFKIWNNWLVEADYHLFAKFGIRDGKDMAKSFIFELLDKEANGGKHKWILPF